MGDGSEAGTITLMSHQYYCVPLNERAIIRGNSSGLTLRLAVTIPNQSVMPCLN